MRILVSALILAAGLTISRLWETCDVAKCGRPFAWRKRTTHDGVSLSVCAKCARHMDRMRLVRKRRLTSPSVPYTETPTK